MKRRDLVFGAAVAAVSWSTEAAAGTGRWTTERVRHLVGRIRAGMARTAESVRKGLDVGAADPELAAAYLEAAPVLYAYGALHDLPLEAQVHRDGQALLLEVAERLGASVARVRQALGALSADVLEDADSTWVEDPGRIDDIVARTTRLAEDASAGPVNVRLAAAQDDLRWRIGRRGVRRSAEELVEAYDRLEALVARHGLDAVPRASARLEARVARARAHWEPSLTSTLALDEVHLGQPAKNPAVTAARVLGVLAGGLLIVGGVLVFMQGVALIACPCVGVPIMLLGALMAYGGVWLIKVSVSHGTRVEVRAGLGWQHGVVALDGRPLRVKTATGMVEVGNELNYADGQPTMGSERALGPGLPIGALIGRLEGRVFVLEARTDLVGTGPLDLAVNREPSQSATGRFVVRFGRPGA